MKNRLVLTAIASVWISLSAGIGPVYALNRLGDLNFDGTVTPEDAPILQSQFLNADPPASVSVLAHADGDAMLDLGDLLYIAQAGAGVRTAVGPGAWLGFTAITGEPINLISGDPHFPLEASVFTTLPASKTDGLRGVASFVTASESIFTTPNPTALGGVLAGMLIPINTGNAPEIFEVSLTASILDSSGGPLEEFSVGWSIEVGESICGNAWKQPGEPCDDGDDGNQNNDCLDGCIAPTCGDGFAWIEGLALEECDDAGDTAACDTDCTFPVCGDGYPNAAAGEACDDFPHNPLPAGDRDTPGFAYGVALSDGRAYVADRTVGLQVIDLSASLPILHTVPLPEISPHFQIAGDRAYVADRTLGFAAIDVSNPAYPIVDQRSMGNWAYGVDVVGQYGLVANGSLGLQILDLTTVGFPVLANPTFAGFARDVTGHDSRAYVAAEGGGVHVFDLSDPLFPLLGSRDTVGEALGVAVLGGKAYVADGSGGLHVLDVVDPLFPILYTVPGLSDVNGVAVMGARAYVADGVRGLLIIDIQQPTYPIIGELAMNGTARGVTAAGQRAYVATDSQGIQRFDITENCRTDCQFSVCGDGVVAAMELCDPNADNYPCAPGGCYFPQCGNGFLDPGEACDDGVANNDYLPDACRSICISPLCGDGVTDSGEACDDGLANGSGPGYCELGCLAVAP